MKNIFLMSFLLLAPLTLHAAENSKQILDTTTTIAGQEIEVTQNPKVQAMVITLKPGQSLPVHKHPYIRYGYVLRGELDVTLVDQKKLLHFKAGDAFAEITDGWHFGTNTGKEPTEILVFDQMPRDAATNTIHKD